MSSAVIDYAARRRRLVEILDGPLLVCDQTNVRYLAGFTGSNGQLLVGPETIFFTDGRYATQSAAQVSGVEIVEYIQNSGYQLAVAKRHDGALFIEAATTTVEALEKLRTCLGRDVGVTHRAVERLRMIKEPVEIEFISKAQELAEAALLSTHEKCRDCTELEFALELEWNIRTAGAGIAFDVIVASGARAALPHARPTNQQITYPLLVDVGARIDGYCSDMTRTWLGDASMSREYEAVLAALKAACETVRAGVLCSEIDRVAREIITDAGFGESFVHSTGHALGLDIHEDPRLAAGCDQVLTDGMVITVEPGIYIEGVGGIRIEDLVVVTNDGPRILTSIPRDLRGSHP